MKLVDNLSDKRCDRSHQHEECGGGNAANSAFYPPQLAKLIVDGFTHGHIGPHVRPAPMSTPAAVKTVSSPQETVSQRAAQLKTERSRQEDIVNTLSRQLDKAFNRAKAKLSSLSQSTDSLDRKMKSVKQTLVDDQLVEKQLMAQMFAKQFRQEPHRKKLGGGFNLFNVMGLITKILQKNDDYHGQEAKDAIDAEITKL